MYGSGACARDYVCMLLVKLCVCWCWCCETVRCLCMYLVLVKSCLVCVVCAFAGVQPMCLVGCTWCCLGDEGHRPQCRGVELGAV